MAEPRMRARMNRRRTIRRLTILVTLLIIAVSLGVGIYLVSLASRGTALDAYINQPVSSSEMAALQKTSLQPYGAAATVPMQSAVQKYGGSPFVTAGRPTVVYVGGEYCQYCAVERWAIVIALMRFGNITNLHYMTSAADEGDYATFTFVDSTYTSNYIAFRPYEAADRASGVLQTVPSNYSAVWTHYGTGFPFLDFGNTYVVSSSLIANPGILQGKNWTSIISGISTSDSTGVQIREAANLITALICKLTQDSPAGVCGASPINSETGLIAGPMASGLTYGTYEAWSLSASPRLRFSAQRLG